MENKFDPMVRTNIHCLCEECCDNTPSDVIVECVKDGAIFGFCKSCYNIWKQDGIKMRILYKKNYKKESLISWPY